METSLQIYFWNFIVKKLTDLSIIIVNYNVKEFLHNLLVSIEKASKDLSVQTIVVDNASEDGSVEFIKEKFPSVNLIENKINLGFSKANNIGLKIADGKFLLLLNPDTLVQENTFTEMIKFFESHTDAGMAGCKILNPDGTLQLACRRSFPGPWTSFSKVTGLSSLFPKSKLFARYNLTYLDENEINEVDAISGSFMMLRKEVYEKIGGLDEIFFMYGEDLDWCYRVQRAGFKVFYVPSTQILHYKGESTKRSSLDETKYFYQAMHLFVRKHLATSFLVEIILRSAIFIRRIFAFVGRHKLVFVSVLLDILFFNFSLYLAEHTYLYFRDWRGFPDFSLMIIYSIPVFVHIIISFSLKIYKQNSLSLLKNISAIITSFIVLSSLTYFFKDFAYSRGVLILAYLYIAFTLSLWRIFYKIFFKLGLPSYEKSLTRALVIGTGSSSVSVAEKLKTRTTGSHQIIGLVASSVKEMSGNVSGFEIVGYTEIISKIIREKKISEIIFPPEGISYNEMMTIVSVCQKENVEFKLAGSDVNFLVGKSSVAMLDDISLINIQYNLAKPLHRFIKKIFDLFLSALLLILLYIPLQILQIVIGRKNAASNFINQIPQVFSGRKSFVGPEKFYTTQNLYLGKEGLTGFWFIEDDLEENREKLDIFYAKNQSIWLDLEILGQTFSKMIFKK